MQAVSDEQLIQWVAKGDSSCLGTLFERHHRAAYQYCLQMTRNPATSEDLVQEVFMRILRKAGSFRGEGSFKAWMFTIARNVTLNHLRRAKRQEPLPGNDEGFNEHLIDHRSAEDTAVDEENVHLVSRALACLPAGSREVIWLGRFEFENYAELAQALGCNPSTARVRMHRAMKQLNEAFTRINGAAINV